MPKVSYPYEVNEKLVTGNGSLIPICSLSNHSFLPSLTVLEFKRDFNNSSIQILHNVIQTFLRVLLQFRQVCVCQTSVQLQTASSKIVKSKFSNRETVAAWMKNRQIFGIKNIHFRCMSRKLGSLKWGQHHFEVAFYFHLLVTTGCLTFFS